MGNRFLQRILLLAALAWPAIVATQIVDSQGKIIAVFQVQLHVSILTTRRRAHAIFVAVFAERPALDPKQS